MPRTGARGASLLVGILLAAAVLGGPEPTLSAGSVIEALALATQTR
jgi:hypothetical protein